MFGIFVLVLFGIIVLIFLLIGKENPKHTASREIIQIVQKKEIDNDKDNETLSEMIEYHKNNPTIKYKI